MCGICAGMFGMSMLQREIEDCSKYDDDLYV